MGSGHQGCRHFSGLIRNASRPLGEIHYQAGSEQWEIGSCAHVALLAAISESTRVGSTRWTASRLDSTSDDQQRRLRGSHLSDHRIDKFSMAGTEPTNIDDAMAVLIAQLAYAVEERLPDHGPLGNS